jgi:hypothetical protein
MTIAQLITALEKVEDKEVQAELYTNPDSFQRLTVQHQLDGTAYIMIDGHRSEPKTIDILSENIGDNHY